MKYELIIAPNTNEAEAMSVYDEENFYKSNRQNKFVDIPEKFSYDGQYLDLGIEHKVIEILKQYDFLQEFLINAVEIDGNISWLFVKDKNTDKILFDLWRIDESTS